MCIFSLIRLRHDILSVYPLAESDRWFYTDEVLHVCIAGQICIYYITIMYLVSFQTVQPRKKIP